MQGVLDFLGLGNLQEHLALESFRYSFGASDMWQRADFDESWGEERLAIHQAGSADDDEIPF
jgi:hypothetical protein